MVRITCRVFIAQLKNRKLNLATELVSAMFSVGCIFYARCILERCFVLYSHRKQFTEIERTVNLSSTDTMPKP